MPSTFSDDRGRITGCVQFAAVFQDPLLEEPPSAQAPLAVRRRHAALQQQADAVCRACPLIIECLYRAVVEHDVSGYVATTTERDRAEIRRRLGLRVGPEDFDTLAGVARGSRQVDHDEVVRLRHANPHESLERLAHRLGCSLSTVKRHLRKERNSSDVRQIGTTSRPTLAQVIAVGVVVSSTRLNRSHAAA